MPNTVRVLTIVGCLCLVTVTKASDEWIKWDNTLTLPAVNGQNNPSLAGVYSGFINDVLIIAGGANFPDAMPWEGGEKVWNNAICFVNIKDHY